jgi:hypothetical protein
MRPAMTRRRSPWEGGLFWSLLTFDRLITGPAIHLIYWSGLGVVALMGFGVVGAAIGLAIRDPSLIGFLLAIPVVVGGLLAVAALSLLWRAMCEFYVAIFRISEDLRALRRSDEASRTPPPAAS